MQEEFYADISPDGKSKFEIERSQTNQQKLLGRAVFLQFQTTCSF